MGVRTAARVRNASPMLRLKDGKVLTALPSPAPKTKDAAPTTERQTGETSDQALHKVAYGAEPPPIMLQYGSTENAFQPVEFLPLDSGDETPISSKSLTKKRRIIRLGFASPQDEHKVGRDGQLLQWIDGQRARQ